MGDEMKTCICLLLAAVAGVDSAHAAEVEGYEVIFCTKLPYPYDADCKVSSYYADRQPCEDAAARFNDRVGRENAASHSKTIMHMTCETVTIDCSVKPLTQEGQLICSRAMLRNRPAPFPENDSQTPKGAETGHGE